MENNENLRQLLELYFEGETTLEQEEQLRKIFCSGEVPAELERYRPLFGYVAQERAGSIVPKEVATNPERTVRRRKLRMRIAAAASIAAVLAGVGLFVALKFSESDNGILLTIGGRLVNDEALAVRIVDRELAQLQDVWAVLDKSMDAVSESVEMRDSTLNAIDERIMLNIKLK